MPRARFFKLKEPKQRTILDAATVEFAEHGLDGASFNRIIAAAGVSKGAMYYYFDDKLDLYTTVLKDALAQRMSVMGEMFGGELDPELDYWSQYEAMSVRMLTWVRAHPEVASLAESLVRLDPNLVADGQLAELYAQAYAEWEAFFALGQATGAVRTDLPRELLLQVSFAMGESMDKWIFTHWKDVDGDGLEEVAATMVDLFRRVLEPRER
jgi:AcrR family transcriptional regulator